MAAPHHSPQPEPDPLAPARPSSRDILVVAILIVGVCGFTLSPGLYIFFRAMQWEGALRALELVFVPFLLLFGMAALLVYRRHQARRALAQEAEAEADELA